MTAYYNEINPFAAEWLRQLIARGHIADGFVDERSIKDVKPEDLKGFIQCHFFAGIGGWSLALRRAGWGDNRHVWTGSCPCQPFSTAGKKKGVSDERHLWPEMFRLIKGAKPEAVPVFGEQVAGKAGESWLDIVSDDMEAQNHTVGAVSAPCCCFGAPHKRQRLYWVADPNRQGLQGRRFGRDSADKRPLGSGSLGCKGVPGKTNGIWKGADWLKCRDERWRPVEPGTFPLANGVPARVGRLRGYGNAIVAEQAKAFIEAFMEVAE